MVTNRNIAVMMTSIALFAGQVCLAPGASAQDISVPNQFELEYVGSALWVAGRDFTVKDHFVYRTAVNGIQVLDISDPAEPRLVAQRYLGAVARCIDYSGNILTAGVKDSILCFDISNPNAPRLLGRALLGSNPSDCEIQTQYAYFACPDGVRVVDIHTPSSPELVAELVLPTEPGFSSPGIRIQSGFVYYTAGDLWIIDVSSPCSPSVVSHFDTPYCAGGLDVKDGLAYVADHSPWQPSRWSALLVIDVSSQSAPQLIGKLDTYGDLFCVAVNGDHVYLAGGAAGLAVLDVSIPETPEPVWCLAPIGDAETVHVNGDFAFVNNSKPPANFGYYDVPICLQYDASASFFYSKPLADTGDFVILDVSEPDSPDLVGRYPHPGLSTGISITDGYAYVTDETGRVTILDVSAGMEPEVVSHIETPGAPRETAITGDILLVADAFAGMQIVDISNKSVPRIVGNLAAQDCCGVAAAGGYAYIAGGAAGLIVADISEPSVPEIVSVLPTADFAVSVILDGDFAYVADRYSGLQIIDISDPELPQRVAQYPDPGEEAWSIYIAKQGDILAVSGGSIVRILDVSDPGQPVLLGSLGSSIIQSVAISGSYLILACHHDGLHVFDISDPSAPFQVSSYATPGMSSGAAFTENTLWVADTYSVLSLTMPVPTKVEEPQPGGSLLPESNELHQNYPNPFNPSTVIEYNLNGREHAVLKVYNILGQEITTLVDEQQSAGRHSASWHGLDRRGNTAASGVYIYRLTAGETSDTKKMLLVR